MVIRQLTAAFVWYVIQANEGADQNLLTVAHRTKASPVQVEVPRRGGRVVNPSVSFADSSLYTREPIPRLLALPKFTPFRPRGLRKPPVRRVSE